LFLKLTQIYITNRLFKAFNERTSVVLLPSRFA